MMELKKLHELFLRSAGVCTDTRKLNPGELFFALKGENFDGNQYAKNAIKNGASYAIIDDKNHLLSDNYILVEDALATLQKLATFHRNYLNIPIIALTGSNGKTTTKELINAVLSTKYGVKATEGNLNNHIGVPLTLLSMDNTTEIGVVEMGANHPGEIDFLCSIALPNYGYITNIGKAHLEGFKDLNGVLEAKTELYRHLQQKGYLIFLNADDQKLAARVKNAKVYTFAKDADADLNIKLQAADPMVTMEFNTQTISSQLIGSYNASNIAAAITIGIYFKIPIQEINTAIASYLPQNNRSQLLQRKDQLIILDAYNANPTSMTAAITNLDQLPQTPKTMFLGDMFELGASASQEHQHILELACQTTVDRIYLLGENFNKTTTKDSRIQKNTTIESLKNTWDTKTKINGVILIKGSRGMQMEHLLDII